MENKIKNLRKPIEAVIGDQIVKLYTLGFITNICGRSRRTLLRYIDSGVMAPAPFVLNPGSYEARRRLWPEAFLLRLEEIVQRGYVGQRMNAAELHRFHRDVFMADQETIAPLLKKWEQGTKVLRDPSLNSDSDEGAGF